MTTQALIFSSAFVIIYGYVAFAHRGRGIAVWLGATLAVTASLLLGYTVDFGRLLRINYNVLLIFSGILIIAEILIETKVPAYLAAKLVKASGSLGTAGILICLLSSVISVFVENVATVMIVAPIAFELTKRLKVSPVPLLIGIAIASNLQGTATLVGDPPSMILAASENLNFNDFFSYKGKPGIFFAVEIGALASFAVLYYFVGRNKERIAEIPTPAVSSWVPTWILMLVIVGLAIISFFASGVGLAAGLLCGVGGLATLVWHALFAEGSGSFWPVRLRPKSEEIPDEGKTRTAWEIAKDFDFDTLFLLAGIFFMVNALETYGVMERVGQFIASVAGNDPFVAFLLIVWGAVAASAFVDNVPFVTAMIPVVRAVGESLGTTSYYYLTFGLLVGSCLGGNISPVGASANIVAVGMLKKRDFRVSFFQFARIGLPFTIAATLAGSLFVWFVWHP